MCRPGSKGLIMTDVVVHRDDPRPPYRQLADHLRAAIVAGKYAPGQRIPSGRDLAEQYGVTLHVAQHAVDHLKTDGVLVAHPPQGTFVAATPSSTDPTEHGGSAEFRVLADQLDRLTQTVRMRLDELDARMDELEQQQRRSKQ